MGLDVTAYSKIQKVDAVFDGDGEPIDPQTREPLDDVVRLQVNYDFPARAADIEDGGIYSFAAVAHVAAGAYSYYNRWREELAKLAGWPLGSYEQYGKRWPSHAASAWDAQSGPFWELILFSDSEGAMGPAVCAKMAKDFADYQAKADAHEDERFRAKYAAWRAAFDLAADGGAMRFH